jgi:hypothetical protein
MRVYDSGGFKQQERLEFRRFAEICPSSSCASIELTWWVASAQPDARIVAIRVVQLGGARTSAEVQTPDASGRSVTIALQVSDGGLFGSRAANKTLRLDAAGQFQIGDRSP